MNIEELINHPNNTYIQESVGEVLALAICESFKNKPEDAIDYIANYLLNHNHQLQAKELDKSLKEQFEAAKGVKREQEASAKQAEAEASKKKGEVETQRNEFVKSITNNEDLQDSMTHLCSHLKDFTQATGCYVVAYQEKRLKEAREGDMVDEKLEDVKPTIKFYAANADHQFLLKERHTIDSLTGSLFTKKEGEAEAPQDEAEAEEGGKPGKNWVYYDRENPDISEPLADELFFPEVIAEPKIHYWRVPKLGSLYALKFKLKSFLSDNSIDNAILDYKSMNERRAKQDEEKRNYELLLRDWEDQQQQGDKPEQPIFEEIKEKPKSYVLRHYAVVLDTLGKERIFSRQERAYVRKAVSQLKTNTENLEARQLDEIVALVVEQDVNNLKEFDNDIKVNQGKWMDRLDVPYSDEGRDAFLKFEAYRESFLDSRNFDMLLKCLSNFRTLKYTNIAVCFLYFFKGVEKAEVMQTDPVLGTTNTVDWLKARRFFTKDLKLAISKYTPKGQKPDHYPQYRKLKYLERELSYEKAESQAVNDFYYGLNLMRELVLAAMACRHVDKDYRSKKREETLAAIQKMHEEKEAWDRRREEEIAAGNAWTEGDYPNAIPSDPPAEIDNDIDGFYESK